LYLLLSSEKSRAGGFNSKIKLLFQTRPCSTSPIKTFVQARDIETIRLSEIVNSVRGEFQGAHSPLKDFAALPRIEKIMSNMENAINDVLSKETLKGLIASHMHDIKNKETI